MPDKEKQLNMRIILKLRSEFENESKYMQYLLDMKEVVTPLRHNDWESDTYEIVCQEFDNLRKNAAAALSKLEESLKAGLQTDRSKGGSD